jgi:hypothetical protein
LSVFGKEEEAPQEEVGPPQTIDFVCDWCDEQLHLPLELGGKQTQCPNPECRRIIKVPLPKIVEKKDWRKMGEKRGPAGAIINQPDVPDDVQGSHQATKARTKSLVEAGVIEIPQKPVTGTEKFFRFAKYVGGFALLLGAVTAGFQLDTSSKQVKAIKEIKQMVDGSSPKITHPLLAAEAHRTIGLLYLFAPPPASETKYPAGEAGEQFSGAMGLAAFGKVGENNPEINEQLFLIDLALAQIERGGDADEVLKEHRSDWGKTVQPDLDATLSQIREPQVRVMAVREVVTRLLQKKQEVVAVGLTATQSSIGVPDQNGKPVKPVLPQQIAMFVYRDEQQKLKGLAKLPEGEVKEWNDADARAGFAEGFARKGDFAKALEVTTIAGPANYRLEACLGVAAIAVSNSKTKDEAKKFVKEAHKIVAAEKDKEALSPWLLLHLVKLSARAEEPDGVKDLIERLPEPFKLRAELELFLAECDRATGAVSMDGLDKLENNDADGITLALAWNYLAQQHARKRYNLKQIRTAFTNRIAIVRSNMKADPEKIRPMVDVGAFLGAVK